MTDKEKQIMDVTIDSCIKIDNELRKFGVLYGSEGFNDLEDSIYDFIKKIGDTLYPDKKVDWDCNERIINSTFGDVLVDRVLQESSENDWVDWALVEYNELREAFYKEAEKWGEEDQENE